MDLDKFEEIAESPGAMVEPIGDIIIGKNKLSRLKAIDPGQDIVAFNRQLGETFHHPEAKLAGRVYLLRLQFIKNELGEKWDSSSDQIQMTVQAVFKESLASHDVYVRYDKLSYLIVFSGIGESEAKIRCAAISQIIMERLFGSEQETNLIEFSMVKSTGIENIGFEDLPDLKSLVNQGLFDEEDEPAQSEISIQSTGAAVSVDDSRKKSNIEFVFRPMLAMRDKVVSTFLCVPILAEDEKFLSGYDVLRNKFDPIQIFDLDMLTLSTTAHEFSGLIERGGRSLVAVPVHFETLAHSNNRREYLAYCAALFANHHNRIVFEIVGLPNGIPQFRLHELVAALKPEARAVMARFSLDHVNFPAFRTAGLHAVGIDIYYLQKSEQVVMQQMEAFLDNAKKSSLKTYILGVGTVSLYTAAVAAGFDYMAGHALTNVARTAEDIYAFRLDMPLLSLLNSISNPQPNKDDYL